MLLWENQTPEARTSKTTWHARLVTVHGEDGAWPSGKIGRGPSTSVSDASMSQMKNIVVGPPDRYHLYDMKNEVFLVSAVASQY
jgi:hypothetical protein